MIVYIVKLIAMCWNKLRQCNYTFNKCQKGKKKTSRVGSRRVAKFLQERILIAIDLIWKVWLSDRNFATLLDPPLTSLKIQQKLSIKIILSSIYKHLYIALMMIFLWKSFCWIFKLVFTFLLIEHDSHAMLFSFLNCLINKKIIILIYKQVLGEAKPN